MMDALLAIYEWNGESRYLFEAERLADVLVAHYWDAKDGGFYLTASDHEELLVRSKTVQDGATPSANSTMALVLQKLAILLGREDYREKAGVILKTFVDSSLQSVFQQERLLCALDAWHGGWSEVAIVGPRDDSRTADLLAAVHRNYRPNKVVAWTDRPGSESAERIPLLAGKGMVDGKPTAYVCQNYVCERPVTQSGELFV